MNILFTVINKINFSTDENIDLYNIKWGLIKIKLAY